jgi:hypothetical protein
MMECIENDSLVHFSEKLYQLLLKLRNLWQKRLMMVSWIRTKVTGRMAMTAAAATAATAAVVVTQTVAMARSGSTWIPPSKEQKPTQTGIQVC